MIPQGSPFIPSAAPHTQLPGFRRTFAPGKLTLGLFFPIEAFDGDTPTMLGQVGLARRAEAGGFASVFVRDVPLRDPSFGDVGHLYDPWTYLGYIAGQTDRIALGTGAIVLPLVHPLSVAKASASIDRLSGGRLLLGVASGDRPVEFPAFGQDLQTRGSAFREAVEVIRSVHAKSFPRIQTGTSSLSGADLIPKPIAARVPMFVTGASQQPMEWIAENADGWLTYPRSPQTQSRVAQTWHQAVAQASNADTTPPFKPLAQSLFIDLTHDPDAAPVSIHQGFRLGRHALIELLAFHEQIGVNHIVFNLKYGQRPACEVIEELIEHVLPRFHAHPTNGEPDDGK